MQGPGSFINRWLDAVRPIPSQRTYTKAELAQKRKQKRMIMGALLVIAIGTGGWYTYDYIANAPQRAQAELAKGMLQMGPGKEAEAIKTLNQAINIWPEFAEAYMYRGIAEHNVGQVDGAIVDLEKASELKPSLTRPYAELGR